MFGLRMTNWPVWLAACLPAAAVYVDVTLLLAGVGVWVVVVVMVSAAAVVVVVVMGQLVVWDVGQGLRQFGGFMVLCSLGVAGGLVPCGAILAIHGAVSSLTVQSDCAPCSLTTVCTIWL